MYAVVAVQREIRGRLTRTHKKRRESAMRGVIRCQAKVRGTIAKRRTAEMGFEARVSLSAPRSSGAGVEVRGRGVPKRNSAPPTKPKPFQITDRKKTTSSRFEEERKNSGRTAGGASQTSKAVKYTLSVDLSEPLGLTFQTPSLVIVAVKDESQLKVHDMIRVGDRVVEAGGIRVRTYDELRNILQLRKSDCGTATDFPIAFSTP